MVTERERAGIEISKMVEENDGKLFMGMVHHMYGPLRGLNFIIENPNIEEVLDSMDSQAGEMLIEHQMELVEKVKANKPTNVIELCFKIWSETALSPRLMVLPFEMADQAENYPNVVTNLEGGIDEVLQVLKMTSTLQSKDPFFFRTGII